MDTKSAFSTNTVAEVK
uniref:Uncharacterized protein n=1 Tax=Anguilla anguilla TaxID=7936 RepID=A0A0E9XKF1_ANGAN